MPGFLVHAGATVLCAHGGQAQPTVVNPRVTVGGRPTVTVSAPEAVAGCTLPPNAGGPCVTAQWLAGTTRVTSGGMPLVVAGSASTCAPTATPLTVVATQTRVTAQ